MASERATNLAEAIRYDISSRGEFDRGAVAAIIDAELADVRAGEGWLPIAEAPRDGTKILVYVAYIDEPLITSGRFYPDGQFRKYEKDYPIFPLTHFMPLPAPPVDRAALQGEG